MGQNFLEGHALLAYQTGSDRFPRAQSKLTIPSPSFHPPQQPEHLRTYLAFAQFPSDFIQSIWEQQRLIQYSGEPVCIVINSTYLTYFNVFKISYGCHVCSETIFRNTVYLCMHICHVLTGHIGQKKREQQIVFRQRFGSWPSTAQLQGKKKMPINKYKQDMGFNP